MAKHLMYGLAAMALVSTAQAGEHYIEVWNPPESRGVVAPHHSKAAHATPKHPKVSISGARQYTRRASAKSVSSPGQPLVTTVRRAKPSVDDIPRRITPEGNVLRVTGGGAHAEIEH